MARALFCSVSVIVVAAQPLMSSPQTLEVFYGPNQYLHGDPDFFHLFNSPGQSWPELAGNTRYVKLFLGLLYVPTVSDDNLSAMISTLKSHNFKTAIEIGGARWGKKGCTTSAMLEYAAHEQKLVSRWLGLGGKIDLVSTDHAMTWNVRAGSKPGEDCVPGVPMATRIDTAAQIFASWRSFLGPAASLGFIESLGYWEIDGLDGTNFTNSDPVHLNPLPGWIPRLDDVTKLLLEAAKKYNPTPSVPLLNHYQIDFGLEGVEGDSARYGWGMHGGLNYGRVVGAEATVQKHGLRPMVIMNAFHGKPGGHCLVSCDELDPSHSAAVRTLNYTGGYLLLPDRLSEHAVVQQWQPYPNVTGPETVSDTGMWMASHAAKLIMEAGNGHETVQFV